MKNGLSFVRALQWAVNDQETHEKIGAAYRIIKDVYYALNWNNSRAMPEVRFFFAENDDGSFDTDLCIIEITEPDTHLLNINVVRNSIPAMVADILAFLNDKVVAPFLS